jgi:eukaryotic-like serine/threonine-protein kinase
MSGELVMDRFRLLERIGSGGMGTVYRAFDERLQRHVAVKEVMVGAPERVIREAQAAARLNHPGIVTLFELGIDGHRALLVSELVDGSTLDELVREGGLCDRDVAELGADVCEALEHAHEHGVIHRDVKPQNVIVREDDGGGRRAKLMDFGIASLAGAQTLTATGEVVGTLAYMAPEQAEGERSGPGSDAYSLALTLYECWVGENPARRPTPAQTARELGSPLPFLADYRPDLPAGLGAAIDACLRPDPELRPALTELHDALEAAIPRLDETYAVPSPHAAAGGDRGSWLRGGARAIAAVVLAVACVVLAGPAGMPGLALLAALLCAPALLLATSPGRAGTPALALVAGALSVGGAYPAAAAAIERTALARFAAGALGWAWLLTGCAALGIAPPAGFVDPPPAGWDESAAGAVDALLVPLLEPEALLGMLAFGLGASVLGRILAARYLAMAGLGALLWAAAMAGVLGLAGGDGLDFSPLVIAVSAACACAFELRARSPRPRFRGHAGPPEHVPPPQPVPSPRAVTSA